MNPNHEVSASPPEHLDADWFLNQMRGSRSPVQVGPVAPALPEHVATHDSVELDQSGDSNVLDAELDPESRDSIPATAERSAGPLARRAPMIAAGLLAVAALVGANLLGDWYQAGQAAVVPEEDTDDRTPAQPVRESPSPSPTPTSTVPPVPVPQPEAPPEDSSGDYVPSQPVTPVTPPEAPPVEPPPVEPPPEEPPPEEPPPEEPPPEEPPPVEPPAEP